MESISFIEIAKAASPWTAIVLALVIILQLIGGKRVINAIRGTQSQKYPELTQLIATMQTLETQNKSLLENHFKHEIPELVKAIDSIKKTVEFIKDNHGNRLTKVETMLKID